MKLLALATLFVCAPTFAQAPDGGFAETHQAKALSAVIAEPLDGGTQIVEGGCWLSESRCLQVGQELAQSRATIAELEKDATGTWTTWLFVGAGLGVLAGLAGGFALGWTTRPVSK